MACRPQQLWTLQDLPVSFIYLRSPPLPSPPLPPLFPSPPLYTCLPPPPPPSPRDCVAVRDPYCAWMDGQGGLCVELPANVTLAEAKK